MSKPRVEVWHEPHVCNGFYCTVGAPCEWNWIVTTPRGRVLGQGTEGSKQAAVDKAEAVVALALAGPAAGE